VSNQVFVGVRQMEQEMLPIKEEEKIDDSVSINSEDLKGQLKLNLNNIN